MSAHAIHPFAVSPDLLRKHGCFVRETAPQKPRAEVKPKIEPFDAADLPMERLTAKDHVVHLFGDVEQALKAVCHVYELPRETLIGKDRTQKPNHARLLLYWICVRVYGISLSQTGRAMKRDHGTIDKGVHRFEVWIKKDPEHTGKIAEHFRRVLQPKVPANL